MKETIEIEEFMNIKEQCFIADFRTEREHNRAKIPGSFSVPIFETDEHREISRLYDEGKIEESKILGVEMVSKKLPEIYKKISKLSGEKPVIGYCSRGGYRSGAIISLMYSLGENVSRLRGGYKAYRKYVNSHLEECFNSLNLISLYGKTGSGKTKILRELEKSCENVIDLEGIANHRGSLLGGIALGEENSQKNFEALLYERIRNHRGERFFIEGESRRIGKIVLPMGIYEHLRASKKVLIEADLDYRIKNIKEEYVKNNDSELIEYIQLLRGRISEGRIENFINLIKAGEYEKVIEELILSYYDNTYKTHGDYILKIKNEDEKSSSEILRNAFL